MSKKQQEVLSYAADQMWDSARKQTGWKMKNIFGECFVRTTTRIINLLRDSKYFGIKKLAAKYLNMVC